MKQFASLSAEDQRYWVEKKAFEIAFWAKRHHPFYATLYRDITLQKSFENFSILPIVTKNDLQQVPLEDRSIQQKERYLTNTGGTSGNPLVFFLDRQAFAREWAHMHFIWQHLGYRTTDLKLVFRGKNLGDRALVYNPVHNEYLVNAYCAYDLIAEALISKLRNNSIRFLHGYPSAIYDFMLYCSENRPQIIDELRKSLKGVLYGSEYPAPMFREPVEDLLQVRSISWYGHSEFSILAYEVEKYLYAPMPTYGYAEAVPGDDGYRLVCTGYYNRVHPFIRYDTGDLIEPVDHDGILRTFMIKEGRVGDFVTDAAGKNISLTALIFGRHHQIFDRVRFLQMAQKEKGHALILISRHPGKKLIKNEVPGMMDLDNVDIKFDFLIGDEPFRTKAGKVILKVPYDQVERFFLSPKNADSIL